MPTPSVNTSQRSGDSSPPLASSNSTETTPPMISATARDFGSTPTPLAPSIQTSPSTPSPSVSPSSGLMSSPISQTIPLPGDPSQIPSMPAPNAADSYKNKLGLNSSVNLRSVHTPIPGQSGSSQYGSTGNGCPTANDIPEAPAFQAPHFHKAQSYQVPSPASCLTHSHPGSTNNGFATPHPKNVDSEAPAFQPPHLQRAQSYQGPPLPTDIHHPHRSATYPANIYAHSSSSPSTPHSSTAAQPPSQSANASGESMSHIQTTVSPPEESFGVSMGSPSQGREGSTTSPPISPADATQFAALAAQASQRAKILKQMGISVGKTAGKAALQIAGNAALLSVGIPPGLAVDVGTSILNSNAVGALVVNAFLGASTGVNLSALLAVLQGQPGADYQGIINALKLQQQRLQRWPQAPPVDYQALLTELTRILLAAAQQQAVAQQQQAPSQQHIRKTSKRTLGAKL